MNNVSLLYEVPDERVRLFGTDDLRLPELVSLIYPDGTPDAEEKRITALSVLRNPLSVPENIDYRKEITRDFISCEGLLADLIEVAAGSEEEKEYFTLLTQPEEAEETALSIFSELKKKSNIFLNLANRLEKMIGILAGASLYSEGMLEFKEKCINLYASIAFSNVPKAVKIAETDAEHFTAELVISVNDSLKADSASINNIHSVTDAKASAVSIPFSCVEPLMMSALRQMNNEETDKCTALIDLFRDVREQLNFYRFAFDLCKAYEERNLSYVFPHITDKTTGITSISLLADPMAALKHTETIQYHDVLLTPESSGLVITGEGGVGKTALLRSICVSQIFAQCGLPIVCRDASLCIRSGIFVCFADVISNEENPLRKFESEASAMAKILDNLTSHSLIALNELFESVSFADAADALYNIFSVISQHNIAFLATTHLNMLAERFVDVDKVVALSMSKDGAMEKL